jgi:hypothetical protein
VQHAEKFLVPKVDCRPATMVLGDLAQRLGLVLPPPSRLRGAVSEDVPAFAGIDWAALPASEGQDLAGADAAAQACKPTGAALRMLANGVDPVGV